MTDNKRKYQDEDVLLMVKASNDDREAYSELYNKYFCAVVSFAASFNSYQSGEDIAQEVFCLIWRKRKDYYPASAFKTYLFGCTRIVLLERLRSFKKDLTAYEIWVSNYYANFSTVLSESLFEVDITEVISKVKKAKYQLTTKQFQAFELFHNMHMSISKATRLTGCTKKAFECRLGRVHKKLHQILVSMEAENA